MKKRRRPDRWLTSCLLLLSLQVAAQESFHYRVPVDTPSATDFYRIVLPPDLVARSNQDLSDLRMQGPDGRFVPYVLKTETHDTGAAGFLPLPHPEIVQKDSSNRHSYLFLRWQENYRVDLLSLRIDYPTLYKRDARIYEEEPDGRWSLIAPISIDPRNSVFRIPAARTRRLKIEIDNADNAPLRVADVSARQSGIYLLTYLQAGHGYALLTGDPKADAPRYDLAYFTDSLTRRPRDIGTAAGNQTLVVISSNVPISTSAGKQGERPGFLLWSILSTVLLLLIYFSVKMVGAISAKKSPHDRV